MFAKTTAIQVHSASNCELCCIFRKLKDGDCVEVILRFSSFVEQVLLHKSCLMSKKGFRTRLVSAVQSTEKAWNSLEKVCQRWVIFLSSKHKKSIFSGELVFDDPLSVSAVNENPDFEWDSQVASSAVTQSSSQEETSAVFQLSKELSNAKTEIEKYRQRLQSYQEVLDIRDKQLFEVRDKISSENFSHVDIEDYKNLEMQVRSYKEQNALLNEEILKLHQMNNKSSLEAKNEKRYLSHTSYIHG